MYGVSAIANYRYIVGDVYMLRIQTIILAEMLVEVVVVLSRQENHLRVTRALRPIFFIDNVLMDGVRR